MLSKRLKPDELMYECAMGILAIVNSGGWESADRYWDDSFNVVLHLQAHLKALQSPLNIKLRRFMIDGGYITNEPKENNN
jgi:hypothetical protein